MTDPFIVFRQRDVTAVAILYYRLWTSRMGGDDIQCCTGISRDGTICCWMCLLAALRLVFGSIPLDKRMRCANNKLYICNGRSKIANPLEPQKESRRDD